MSTSSPPSTPIARTVTQLTPKTGTWRHPQFDEISRRQNALKFSDRDVKHILYNIGGLISTWVIGRLIWETLPSLFSIGGALHPYTTYAYYVLQLLLVFNIVTAILPLFRPKDDLSDIALTPAQRKLLGLPPTSVAPTPGSQYVTPPRYARTPTPLSGSPSSKGSYSDSPLSGKGSPTSRNLTGSPFSPGTSPLLQKAMGGIINGSRRHSYGSPSPLGPGTSRINVLETPGTPSPSNAKGASVGLNNRWLYDKGRRNSGTARLYT